MPILAVKPQAIFLDAAGTLFKAQFSSPSGLQLYPDARRLLGYIKARKMGDSPIKTGLITNWGQRIHGVLENFELQHHFDAVVCAAPPLHPKPDASIFIEACAQVALEPAVCLHIGDSLHDDVIGAQSAGLQSVWVRRRNLDEADNGIQVQLKSLLFSNLDDVCSFLLQEL